MPTQNDKTGFSGAVTTASAGIVTAAFTIIACGSFAALIFAGQLDQYVTQGIWIGLFTALVVGLVISLTSSYTGAIAIPQDRVAPILALMAASIVTRMGIASPQEKCLAVLASIAAVSLITGIFLFVLGRFRLGNMIRYIPYPVIGGFLAGSGWLLVRGSFRVMTGHPLSFGNLRPFFTRTRSPNGLPGAIFGGLLFFKGRAGGFRHPLTVPVMLFGAIVLFFVFLFMTGRSLEAARSVGWLPNFPTGSGSSSFSPFFVINLAPWHLHGPGMDASSPPSCSPAWYLSC